MSSGAFPALEETPASRFVERKGLTEVRTRAAIKIEGLLFENEHLFYELLTSSEEVVAPLTQSWGIPASETRRKSPLQIGNHGLLAYPGAYLEGGDSLAEDVSKVRFLVKVAWEGTVFHLSATIEEEQVVWNWQSLEALHSSVRKECLRFLRGCVRDLIEESLPELLGRIRG